MCKSKKNTDVIEPKSAKSRSSKPLQSSFQSSSIADPSASTNFISINFTTTGSSYNSKSSSSSKTSLSSLKESLPENPHIYDFAEICAATNNFLSNRFSSSSSSSSWRCSIRGKEAIIFQRKSRVPIHLPELKHRLSLVCRSHHSSLIKLFGATVSGNYIYLVYEFVQGANLANCLRNSRNPNFTVLSTWISRMQIATDLAHGLDYIHHGSGPNSNFIHNHIKTSSIIIEEESLSPKFCHFGAAELCGEVVATTTASEEVNNRESEISINKQPKRSNSNKMKVEGTRGYMAPEFQSKGILTQKSDVYAFGIVILELISGEEALRYRVDEESGGYKRVSVIDTAREALENGGYGRVRRWVDRRLRDSFPVEVAEKMVVMGLECVEEDPNKRPDMGRVVGLVSKLYLDSKKWAESIGLSTDFSVSMAPR